MKSPQCSTESRNLSPKELDEKPWKYIGYKGYSSFLSTENDFLIFRRFGVSSTCVALRLQDRVSVLENELKALDEKYSLKEAPDVHNGSFRQDEEDRAKLLRDLSASLMEYNTFMLQQAELKRYPQPATQDIISLENWHWNHNNCAIAEEEKAYLSQKHDLFSLVPRIKTPLRRLLDRSKKFKLHRFWHSKDKPELPFYDDKVVTYTSDKRIDRFITVIIITVGMAMLIAPIWILQALRQPIPKLGTITAFILLFLGMISYATVAKPFETLAATAAYSAVLMVFLQLGTTPPA